MSFKVGFEHLKDNEVIKYLLHYKFQDDECNKIILSRIHNGKFWLDDRVIDITANLIHEVKGLSKSRVIPFNEKNVKKIMLDNTKSSYNGRGIVIRKIIQDDVRYVSKILTSKFCANYREDDMAAGMVHTTYLMCVEKVQVDKCEILRIHLFENLEKIKKTKNSQFRFSSLITYMLFQLLRRFPYIIGEDWNDNTNTMDIINKVYLRHPVDKVNESTTLVMKTFKNQMRKRSRIPPVIVEKYKNEICFMVDIDFTFVEAVEPRVEFIDPLGYEVSEAKMEEYISRLVKCKLDANSSIFGTYEEKFNSKNSLQAEKLAKKRVDNTIKKILKDTSMTGHEFIVTKQTTIEIRDIGQKEVLSIPPITSVATHTEETQDLEEEIEVVEVQELRKSTRSSTTPPAKRVKEMASGPRKRQKTIYTPTQRKVLDVKDDEEARISRKKWKPKIEKLNALIINEGDFTEMKKNYESYNFSEKLNLENVVIRHIILADKNFDSIQGKIPNELFEKLVNRKKRAVEEDKSIRENYVRKLCEIKDEENFKEIMKNLNTHLRMKRRTILIMGGNYEEINKEKEEVVVKVMTSSPNKHTSVSDQVLEARDHKIPSPSPPPSINIEDETMNVEGTNITLDSEDNPFNNLENIVDNSAIEQQDMKVNEEERKETRKEEEEKKTQEESQVNVEVEE